MSQLALRTAELRLLITNFDFLAVILPCSVQNSNDSASAEIIRQPRNMLWANEISRDLILRWVSDAYAILSTGSCIICAGIMYGIRCIRQLSLHISINVYSRNYVALQWSPFVGFISFMHPPTHCLSKIDLVWKNLPNYLMNCAGIPSNWWLRLKDKYYRHVALSVPLAWKNVPFFHMISVVHPWEKVLWHFLSMKLSTTVGIEMSHKR